jgi:hypothetical protein
MKLVDEPAADLEPELARRGIAVRREPYDPKSRSLVADFFRFLRDPEPGDTVTLWEDENGRVRYFTVQRLDPDVAALQARVDALSRPDPAIFDPRFNAIEQKLARLDSLEARVAKVDELETRVAKIDDLEVQVQRLPQLEQKVAQFDQVATQVQKLPQLESQVADLGKLAPRIARLEKPPG